MEYKTKGIAVEIDISVCTGCRACELACSFFVQGVCDPAISKIRIIRNNQTGEVMCRLPLSCPECVFEVMPLCVYSCGIGALRIKE